MILLKIMFSIEDFYNSKKLNKPLSVESIETIQILLTPFYHDLELNFEKVYQ